MTYRTIYSKTPEVLRQISSEEHEDHKEVTVLTQQEIEPVQQLADELRDYHQVIGHRRSRNMVPVAEIPMIIWEQAFREGWLHDKKKWKKWVNDPQNRCFRITDGRV